jgi:integrase
VNYKRVVGSIFSLAVKRGHLASNPVSRVDAPKITRKAPCILTPPHLKGLLDAADAVIRPLLVLQAFAGLRRAEAERLTWGHIHLDKKSAFVELPSEVTKTNRRRTVELQKSAVAWLAPLKQAEECLLGLNENVYRKHLKAAANAAGISWEENLLRHSFGSYRLAVVKNAAAVAEEMGNSANIVRTHYTNPVRPAAVAAYWRVAPRLATIVNPFRKKAE